MPYQGCPKGLRTELALTGAEDTGIGPATEAKSIRTTESALGRLAPAAYLVALALIVTPLLEASTRILPMRPSDVGWRFGAMGIVFNTLVTPMLGVLIAMVVASVRGHGRTLRWLSVASYAAAVLTAMGLVLFLFDYVQARAGVLAERQAGLDVVSWKAMFLGAFGVVVAGVLGRSGWNASRTVETKRGSAAKVLEMPGGAPE